MVSQNVLTRIRTAAARHLDNPIIKALMEKLELAVMVAQHGRPQISELAGYHKGTDGEDGYQLLLNPPRDLLSSTFHDVYKMHEVAITADCLVTALAALGEAL